MSAEVQGFIFNYIFIFSLWISLVMFMAAGFAMLESGMVTSKSVSVICAKNIGSIFNSWNYVLAYLDII